MYVLEKIAMSGLQPSQVSLRHLRVAAYRCFLPDLTGFTGRIAQDQRSAADQTRRFSLCRHYTIRARRMPVWQTGLLVYFSQICRLKRINRKMAARKIRPMTRAASTDWIIRLRVSLGVKGGSGGAAAGRECPLGRRCQKSAKRVPPVCSSPDISAMVRPSSPLWRDGSAGFFRFLVIEMACNKMARFQLALFRFDDLAPVHAVRAAGMEFAAGRRIGR